MPLPSQTEQSHPSPTSPASPLEKLWDGKAGKRSVGDGPNRGLPDTVPMPEAVVMATGVNTYLFKKEKNRTEGGGVGVGVRGGVLCVVFVNVGK